MQRNHLLYLKDMRNAATTVRGIEMHEMAKLQVKLGEKAWRKAGSPKGKRSDYVDAARAAAVESWKK